MSLPTFIRLSNLYIHLIEGKSNFSGAQVVSRTELKALSVEVSVPCFLLTHGTDIIKEM